MTSHFISVRSFIDEFLKSPLGYEDGGRDVAEGGANEAAPDRNGDPVPELRGVAVPDGPDVEDIGGVVISTLGVTIVTGTSSFFVGCRRMDFKNMTAGSGWLVGAI